MSVETDARPATTMFDDPLPLPSPLPVHVPESQHGRPVRSRPPVVALLGETRNAESLTAAALERTRAGEVVLHPTPTSQALGITQETDEVYRELRDLEAARVGMATYVLVVAPDGYVGAAEREMITHASRLGKPVHFWGWITDQPHAEA